VQSGAGTIVNIGGLTGHSGAAHRVHVVAAKAGLAGLTKALAHELPGDGSSP
jgi:3-oxoacyl-[acyl-carrier protein] reductase